MDAAASSLAAFRLLGLLLLVLGTSPAAGGTLDKSDFEAAAQVLQGLGLLGQRHPCRYAGVTCSHGRVVGIVLQSQRLNGSISPAIGWLEELRELSLPHNHLSFAVPREIANCGKLEVLNLRNNRFSGEVPPEIWSLVSLRHLDLSSNELSGDLSFLRHFPNLEYLSLADNLFSGKIPLSLRSFRNLRFVNLTGNLLQGPLPAAAHIEEFSHSSEKRLPRRYRLAEKPSNSTHHEIAPTASPRRSDSSPAPAPAPLQHRRHRKVTPRRVGRWIVGFLVGAFGGILSAAVLSLLFRALMNCIRGRRKVSGIEIFSNMIKRAEELEFLEKEDGFAALELVGSGGCGKVYKAELPGSNGQLKVIAIKKIEQPSSETADLNEEDSKLLDKRLRQIRSEIQTVGHIRHRNLMPLLAHVTRPDSHCLVYEFMKNGSLQDVLNQVAEGQRELEWAVRHRIACGIAAGLEYLHVHHTPRIIHRDLKPANILLDDALEARIADFGLAKALPELNTHMTTSNVVGTLGFIGPEYHQTLKFTDKCDIYSFGVLLAVLVMGKLPSDQFFQQTEELSLVKWLRNVMVSDQPKRAIDPKLMGKGFEEQMLLVLKIACFCTVDDPKQRPNSKDVRCMLDQVRQ